MAIAVGVLASAAFSGLIADQTWPASAVWLSGVKVRSWLGLNAVIAVVPEPAARTRPPLSAVPGGVTRFHRVAPAGRTRSCQKFSYCAADPPMSTVAHVPAAV